jgi:DNA-binding cell septation regulator SpoVG
VLSDGDGNPRFYNYANYSGVYRNANSSVIGGINEWYNSGGVKGVLTFGASYDAASAGDALLKVYTDGTYTTPKLYVVSVSNGVYLAANGTSWTANSDERLKDIIEPISDAANKVSSLRAVIGKYKTDAEGTRRSFLIAQDVQSVLPEAVTTNTIKDDPTEYLGVAYTDVIPLLVAAIKEQQDVITQLKARLDAANL